MSEGKKRKMDIQHCNEDVATDNVVQFARKNKIWGL